MPAHDQTGQRVTVVTGAGQGIGRAVALRLAARQDIVIVADRASRQAHDVARLCDEAGGKGYPVIVDLEHAEGAQRLFRQARDEFGRIDVSVHNVGGTIWAKPFWEYKAEEIKQEIQRSLWPTIWCCREVIPHMIEQAGGVIVNVGSVATRGIHRVPYAAAKGGVAAMTTSLAMELAEHNIRINCVAPGGTDVGRREIPRNPEPLSDNEQAWMQGVVDQTLRDTPMKRFGVPDEIAATIAFMASDDASYITGQTLYVAGGGIG